MDVQDAIKIIEESPDYEQFAKLKNVFNDRIEKLTEGDFTERGICYYYLLRIVLRSQLMYETEECREYFEKMNEEFKKQMKKYKKDGQKFEKSEVADFYHLMERSYGSLEIIFRKKDFFEEEHRCYQEKMTYRRHFYWFKGQLWPWFEYLFLEKTSSYGNNFLRWGATAFLFAMLMALIYAGVDHFLTPAHLTIVPESGHWFDYGYFSVITVTSLGFGDIVAKTFLAKLLVAVEVFFGFVMLGIFITLIQKKM